jgi:diamine N-acetyltransferase
MSDEVKLNKVTTDNWEAVDELELGAGQEDPLASNLYSVAQAQYDPNARPRAVYAWKRVIGFLMYDMQKPRVKAQEASIHRFMNDRKHQCKGYGRAALIETLEEIRAIPGVNRISICTCRKTRLRSRSAPVSASWRWGGTVMARRVRVLKL